MGTTIDSRLKAKDLFDSLKPEKEQEEDRKIEVRKSKGLDAIIEGYKRAIENFKHSKNFYGTCEKSLPREYTSEDITKFSIIFPKFQVVKSPNYEGDLYSAYYFSALINNCKENKPIELEFRHYSYALGEIGYKNSNKNILIRGNGGHYLGDYMSGGKIVVTGDAKFGLGHSMSGGEIVVNGNCLFVSIGTCMTGGIIRINGKMCVPDVLRDGGDIYHYKKLIVKDGRLIK